MKEDHPHRVLLGAGHAHLYALSRIGEWVEAGSRVTVIAPGPFWYSGMGPGCWAGPTGPRTTWSTSPRW